MLAKYETGEYRNQTSLHVAVANGNLTIVEQLMTSLDNEVFCCADIKRYDINCVQASLKSAKNVHNGCIQKIKIGKTLLTAAADITTTVAIIIIHRTASTEFYNFIGFMTAISIFDLSSLHVSKTSLICVDILTIRLI